jgi:hypothetical protein
MPETFKLHGTPAWASEQVVIENTLVDWASTVENLLEDHAAFLKSTPAVTGMAPKMLSYMNRARDEELPEWVVLALADAAKAANEASRTHKLARFAFDTLLRVGISELKSSEQLKLALDESNFLLKRARSDARAAAAARKRARE